MRGDRRGKREGRVPHRISSCTLGEIINLLCVLYLSEVKECCRTRRKKMEGRTKKRVGRNDTRRCRPLHAVTLATPGGHQHIILMDSHSADISFIQRYKNNNK